MFFTVFPVCLMVVIAAGLADVEAAARGQAVVLAPVPVHADAPVLVPAPAAEEPAVH